MGNGEYKEMNVWVDCLIDMYMYGQKLVDKYRDKSWTENIKRVVVT
jgi:hypothetical protein